jgi:GNAT superfamily N-acetyltransferase
MLAAPGHELIMAFVDGEPVGTAASIGFERSAYLIGAVVLPAWRGRGAYRAMVAHRLERAHAASLELVTCHARADSSGPLLERLGFVDLFRYPMYFSPPR